MRTITVTRQNLTNLDAGNNTFEFQFNGSADLTNCEIALSSMYVYYSWYNISATLGNNTFKILQSALSVDDAGTSLTNSPWSLGSDGQGLSITIPDGQYEVADLNAYFQQWCLDNNFYLIDTSTQEYVYFLQMQVNPTRYKVQINVFALPDGGLPPGYTAPTGGFLGGLAAQDSTGTAVTVPNTGAFPTTGVNQTPGMYLPSGFNKILGYSPAPYTISSTTAASGFPDGALSYLSTVSPQIQPNPVAFLTCNAIDNEYTNPATFLYAIPAKSGAGDLLVIEPANYNWGRLKAGIYNTMLFQITTDTYAPLTLEDPNIVITLVIRDMSDLHSDTGKSGSFETAHASSMQKFARHPHNTQHKGRETQATQAGKGFGNRGLYSG